jgi:Leucine-rich repeat (LRR) protein
MSNKRIEQLNKTIEEGKDVSVLNLSVNGIADVGTLSPLKNLVTLNLCKNKIKSLSVFTNEENFPNLKWLDLSSNKYTELAAFKLPKLEYLDISHNKLEKVNEGW